MYLSWIDSNSTLIPLPLAIKINKMIKALLLFRNQMKNDLRWLSMAMTLRQTYSSMRS